MKSLAKEKCDQADTAFLMYENALRRTDKLMDELKPEDRILKDPAYNARLNGIRKGLEDIDIEEDKPTKSNRSRSKSKKKTAASQKTDLKMEPLQKEQVEYYPDQPMYQLEEEVTCPCGQNKDGDWVGCDMHEKCEHEWFHLKCAGLEHVPAEDELWFCEGCHKKYKKEIEQKMKEANQTK